MGRTYGFRPKKDESAVIMEWMQIQSNLNDSLRWLMEQEVRTNGLRNLQMYIPAKRPMLTLQEIPGIPETAANTFATYPLVENSSLQTHNLASEPSIDNQKGNTIRAKEKERHEAILKPYTPSTDQDIRMVHKEKSNDNPSTPQDDNMKDNGQDAQELVEERSAFFDIDADIPGF